MHKPFSILVVPLCVYSKIETEAALPAATQSLVEQKVDLIRAGED